eukprot:g25378.t1
MFKGLGPYVYYTCEQPGCRGPSPKPGKDMHSKTVCKTCFNKHSRAKKRKKMAQSDDFKQQAQDSQAESRALKDRESSLQARLELLQETEARLQHELKQLRDSESSLKVQVQVLQMKVKDLEGQVENKDSLVEALKHESIQNMFTKNYHQEQLSELVTQVQELKKAIDQRSCLRLHYLFKDHVVQSLRKELTVMIDPSHLKSSRSEANSAKAARVLLECRDEIENHIAWLSHVSTSNAFQTALLNGRAPCPVVEVFGNHDVDSHAGLVGVFTFERFVGASLSMIMHNGRCDGKVWDFELPFTDPHTTAPKRAELDCLSMLRAFCDLALLFAKEDFLHRDLSPANIYFMPSRKTMRAKSRYQFVIHWTGRSALLDPEDTEQEICGDIIPGRVLELDSFAVLIMQEARDVVNVWNDTAKYCTKNVTFLALHKALHKMRTISTSRAGKKRSEIKKNTVDCSININKNKAVPLGLNPSRWDQFSPFGTEYPNSSTSTIIITTACALCSTST